MRDRIAKFMAGRNGNDRLNLFLIVIGIIFIILGVVFRDSAGLLFNTLTLVIIVLVYFRMFSKNLSKRQTENAKYMEIRYVFISKFRLLREKWVQRNEYKFFRCPSCRTALRVPRGRGKIMIVCKKCGTRFEGRS